MDVRERFRLDGYFSLGTFIFYYQFGMFTLPPLYLKAFMVGLL